MATEVTLPRLGQGMEVGHDRALAEGRGRHGRPRRAALRARHGEGHPGGRGGVCGCPAQDPRARGRGDRGRQADLRDRRGRRGGSAGRRGRRRCDAAGAVRRPPRRGAAEPEAEDEGLAASAEAPAPAPSRRTSASRAARPPREAAAEEPGRRTQAAPARSDRSPPGDRGRGERLKASPLARRIAKERGIDLRRVDRDRPRREDRGGGRRARGRGARLGGEAGTARGGSGDDRADERPPDDRQAALRGLAGTPLRDLDDGGHARAIELRERLVERTGRASHGRPTRTS